MQTAKECVPYIAASYHHNLKSIAKYLPYKDSITLIGIGSCIEIAHDNKQQWRRISRSGCVQLSLLLSYVTIKSQTLLVSRAVYIKAIDRYTPKRI